MKLKKIGKLNPERIDTLAIGFLILISLAGTNAFANFSVDRTFTKHTYLNPDYNPSAKPVFVEECVLGNAQGEICGEELLNASDFQETFPYRKFFINDVAVFLVGYNEWEEEDMINPLLIYWAITIALTYFCSKRILKSLAPHFQSNE
jgi:hypothetical protein